MNIYKTDKTCILHFGLGLIGAAFCDLYKNYSQDYVIQRSDLEWTRPESIVSVLEESLDTLAQELEDSQIRDFIILWTAGKAGFSADEAETNKELKTFEAILNTLLHHKTVQSNKASFILLSSAGGLFEGQSNIDNNSIPAPKRPYGQLKLHQEQRLLEASSNFERVFILRPSSVFTLKNRGRKGLINTLVENSKSRDISSIFGESSTLRDYILDEDIAFQIYCIIQDPGKYSSHINYQLLASGRPLSIHEIIHTMETTLGRPLSINYTPVKKNKVDITFNRDSIIQAKKSQEISYLITRLLN